MHHFFSTVVFIMIALASLYLSLALNNIQNYRSNKASMNEAKQIKVNNLLAFYILALVFILNMSVRVGQWIYPNEIGGFHLHGVFISAALCVGASILSSKNISHFCATFLFIVPSFFMLKSSLYVVLLAPFFLSLGSILAHVLFARLTLFKIIQNSITNRVNRDISKYIES